MLRWAAQALGSPQAPVRSRVLAPLHAVSALVSSFVSSSVVPSGQEDMEVIWSLALPWQTSNLCPLLTTQSYSLPHRSPGWWISPSLSDVRFVQPAACVPRLTGILPSPRSLPPSFPPPCRLCISLVAPRGLPPPRRGDATFELFLCECLSL